jgi:hypothetical protein
MQSSQSLVPYLSQTTRVHTLKTYFFKIHFNIIRHCPELFKAVFSFHVLQIVLFMHLSNLMHATCPAQFTFLNFVLLIIFAEKYKLRRSSPFRSLAVPFPRRSVPSPFRSLAVPFLAVPFLAVPFLAVPFPRRAVPSPCRSLAVPFPRRAVPSPCRSLAVPFFAVLFPPASSKQPSQSYQQIMHLRGSECSM